MATRKRSAENAPKPRSEPRAKKKAAAAPRRARRTPAPAPDPVAPEERSRLIAEAAYFKAEQRGFAPGDDVADWLEAEREVDAKLAHGGD